MICAASYPPDMKTYYLIFDGDPKPHLELLEQMDIVTVFNIGPSLHCVSFGPNLVERTILNALPHQPVAFLLPAELPIYPKPAKALEAQIARMIAESDGDSASISARRVT